jgi:hypothetical protein
MLHMDLNEMVRAIDEIDRLNKARSLLTGHTASLKRALPRGNASIPAHKTARAKRTMSPEGRARIAAAQRARWAKAKKG